MAKLKHGQALFEVFDNQVRSPVDVRRPRDWMVGDRPSDRPGKPAARRDSEAADQSLIEAADLENQVSETYVPLARLSGDRLTLTFTTKRAAAAIFVGMAALAIAFLLGDRFGGGFRRGFESGRISVENAPVDEIEAVRNQPPATHLVEGLLVQRDGTPKGASGPSDTSRPSASTKWLNGHSYVVVQEFSGGLFEDATKAQTYLAGKGVAADVAQLANGAIQLVATRGFNMKDPAQKQDAEQFLDRIHKLGAEYYSSGGRYRLKGYFKTVRDDS